MTNDECLSSVGLGLVGIDQTTQAHPVHSVHAVHRVKAEASCREIEAVVRNAVNLH